MADQNKLQQVQQSFSTMLREKQDHGDFPHIEDRRLKVYQELFYNNINGLLSGGFPVFCKILGEEKWKALIEDFWLNHRCQTPYFPKIGAEFFAWLQQQSTEQSQSILKDFPFTLELAHYELMEVVVDTAEVELPDLSGAVEQLRMESTLVINPVSSLLHYNYPVQQISVDFVPEKIEGELSAADKTHIFIYRQRDKQVKFIQLSTASVILVELLQTEPRTLKNLIDSAEQTLKADAGSLSTHIENQVKDFIQRDIIFI